jgi:glycolate oxidase FAD binding subunit
VTERPATTDEVAAILRDTDPATVLVTGNGTKRDRLPLPKACDVTLATTALDRVVEHAAGDLVVTVEAGVPLARLQQVLAAQGQRLAVAEEVPGTTVGGAVATGAAGPTRLLHGSVRDLIIGVTVVRADGVIAHSGGRVVKNVAGYDLGKLLSGSHGTLGVITQATFRLHPLPAARAYVTADADDPQTAWILLAGVLDTPLVPAAVELDAVTNTGEVRLTVGFEGTADGVADRCAALRGLWGRGEIEHEPPPWWGVPPTGDGGSLVSLTTLPGELPALLTALRAVPARLRGSAGNGAWLVALPAGADPATTLGGLSGPPFVLTGPGERSPLPAIGLMRRIKDQFDPGHRLSPGRFAEGI